MNRINDLVLGAIALAIALAGSAVVLLLPLAAPLCGILFATLSGAALVWTLAEQAAARRAGYATLTHMPWTLLALSVIVVVAWMLPLFAPLTLDSSALLALPLFLSLLAYVTYLPATLLFWYAADVGLTQQILGFRRTLPWPAIDWVYGASQTTKQTVYQVMTVAQWTDRVLIVEAGANRLLRVLLAVPLVGGDAGPLLAAIQIRATNARFGFDKLPAVLRARQVTGRPVSRPITAGDGTLSEAIRLARGGAVPDGWALFPLRPHAVWSNLVVSAMVGLGLIAAMSYLFIAGKVIVPGFISGARLGPHTARIIGSVELALAIIVGVALIVLALRWIPAISHPSDYFFLITPRYFAAVYGEKVRAVAIADVRRVVTENGYYGLRISAQLRSGKKVAFDYGRLFGPPRTIYGYLQAALSVSTGVPSPQPAAALNMTLETKG